MIIKSSNLLYLFDFDGTLAGTDGWNGWVHGVKSVFKKCYFKPNKLDIRWCILTARPKMDIPIVHTACRWHGLNPTRIYTSDTWFYKFHDLEDEMRYKHNFIKGVLDKKIRLDFASRPITKIFYIDNNSEATKIMNSMRGQLNYVSMSIVDLYKENFTSIII